MTELRLPRHGRNHACGGSDPIPGICDVVSVPVGGTVDELILSTVPGAYYKLNETTGGWADSSGAGRHATYTVQSGTVRGVASGYDESDGSLSVGVHGGTPSAAHSDSNVGSRTDSYFTFAGTAAFSVTARIRPASLPTGIFSMGICGTAEPNANGWGLYLMSANFDPDGAHVGGKPTFCRYPARIDQVWSPVPLTVGVWVRLTATFNGTSISFYLDDTHIGDLASSSAITAGSTTSFRIGSVGADEGIGGTFAPFDGEIDSVAVWSRALTSAEVGAIANFVPGAAAGTVPTSDGAGGIVWTTPSGPPTGPAGGDLSGTYPDPDVATVDTAVLGSGGASSSTFLRGDRTWAVPAGGGAPTGPAGGALDGSYPNPGLAASVAGAGLSEAADVLSVNVDGSTLEVAADTLRVKADGITSAQIAADAVGASELVATAVTPGSYGDATHVAAFTVDQDGRLSAASSVAVAGSNPALDTEAWMPLTTVVGGVPDLVWDAGDSLVPTLTPI